MRMLLAGDQCTGTHQRVITEEIKMSKHAMTSDKASEVKRGGHKKEEVFDQVYGDPGIPFKPNYIGPGADNHIGKDKQIAFRIRKDLDVDKIDLSVSLKGGDTIQFLLGNFHELNSQSVKIGTTSKGETKAEHDMSWPEMNDVLISPEFWNRILKKKNIDILCYDDKYKGEYLFFKMDDIVDFICKRTKWRILDTGRVKGDIGGKQYLTYEYRSKKKTFVFGAHGGKKGREFIYLLKENLRHVRDPK